ncbi:MAG: hypothetical protein ACC707_10675 [Thiohalomonadales bacterium]
MVELNKRIANAQPDFSPLRTIMQLNQQVKHITYHASKVYLTALNAMFMARRVSSKTMAYTRVTTELRKFSHQMDTRMQELSDRFSEMVYEIADCRKAMRRKKSMRLALNMVKISNSTRVAELRMAYSGDNDNVETAFATMRQIIGNETKRLNDIIRIGQNLVVLSKVEAMQAEGYTEVLIDISRRIETRLDSIEYIVKEMQQKVA